MQAPNLRYFFLIGILAAGAGLYALMGAPAGTAAPRWPDQDAVYSDAQWAAGPLKVDHSSNNTDLLTRVYRSPSGATAQLTVVTNKAPKLYAAGAEVPLLGSGYAVTPAPETLAPGANDGVEALVAAQGDQQWLMMYAYGEQRGLLGNGARAWSLAILDGLLGRPNDYYKMYLITRVDQDPRTGPAVAELAHTVFPHIAEWYAA